MSSSSSSESNGAGYYVINNQIPTKSRERYLKSYNDFIVWKNAKGAKSFSEKVFLAYFKELAKSKQPSTLWSTYSMLKSTVNNNNSIQIETYSKLLSYLKKQYKGHDHESKKSKIFSIQNVKSFLNEAPDKDFLAIKVALIFGIHGACRCNELLKLRVDDIENNSDQLLLVKLTDSISNNDKSFNIPKEYQNIVEKYRALRPSDIGHDRFFIRYQNGKCFNQAIGKNRFFKMPQVIASYLKLPDVKSYKGHCFRRTSAALRGQYGECKSDKRIKDKSKSDKRKVVEGFLEVYIENEAKTSSCTVENIKFEASAPSSPAVVDNMKSEASASRPTSPQSSTSEVKHRELSSPQNEHISHQSDTEIILNAQSVNKTTTIPVHNKTITITFQNCTNVSNINISF